MAGATRRWPEVTPWRCSSLRAIASAISAARRAHERIDLHAKVAQGAAQLLRRFGCHARDSGAKLVDRRLDVSSVQIDGALEGNHLRAIACWRRRHAGLAALLVILRAPLGVRERLIRAVEGFEALIRLSVVGMQVGMILARQAMVCLCDLIRRVGRRHAQRSVIIRMLGVDCVINL